MATFYDEDKAADDCRRVWRALGRALAKKSLEKADAGYAETAVLFARAAEACFWQATGVMDASNTRNFVAFDRDARAS